MIFALLYADKNQPRSNLDLSRRSPVSAPLHTHLEQIEGEIEFKHAEMVERILMI